jgi:peptide/nickel transport system ATP-binding protein
MMKEKGIKNEEINENVLSIKDLTVYFESREIGICKAVNHFSLDVKKGETIGLVGETGAGKTTVALSILHLLQMPPGKIISGEILYRGHDVFKMSQRELRMYRGAEVSMIFQDPMTALNPIESIGEQIAEVIRIHKKLKRADATEEAMKMLETVGISRDRYYEYPHQFSGGMKQRVIIAVALACNPHVLLADEPTTALDVTIQSQVLQMINELKEKFSTAVLLITHDLGVVAEMCSRVAVMYAGEIVEIGDTEQIFEHTSHPYTQGLFDSIPKLTGNEKRLKSIPGLMPDPNNLPDGCSFYQRCQYATSKCKVEKCSFDEVAPGHYVRCHHKLIKEKEYG